MVQFISLIFILITFYWVSMLKFIYGKNQESTQKGHHMALWVKALNPRMIWGSSRSLRASLVLYCKFTGTLVTKLIQYCNPRIPRMVSSPWDVAFTENRMLTSYRKNSRFSLSLLTCLLIVWGKSLLPVITIKQSKWYLSYLFLF